MCTYRANTGFRALSTICTLLLAAGRVHAQCEVRKLSFGSSGDGLAYTVGISEDVCVLAAPGADRAGPNSGAAMRSEYVAGSWGSLTDLPWPDGPVQAFGRSVCAGENRIFVASASPPVVYVLERNELDEWEHVGQFTGGDVELYDGFAESLAASGDTIIVGANDDSNENGAEAGSAYVFERDPNGSWIQTQKLLASDGQSNAEFGKSVAIEGDVFSIGAWTHWTGGYAYSGRAYIYERDEISDQWIATAALGPPVSHSLQGFGRATAAGSNAVMVGAESDRTAGTSTGAVYVFAKDPDGAWTYAQTLGPPTPGNSQFFSSAIALDGDRAIIGARGDANPAVNTGAAYLFIRELDGVWRQHAKFTASDGQYYDQFGYSVALDGSWAVIGAPYDDDNGTDSGSAYIFRVGPDWSGNGVPDICECPGDIDYSGAVGLSDLSALLTNFGLAAGQSYESGDIDGDYDVDVADLSALLERYGVECP